MANLILLNLTKNWINNSVYQIFKTIEFTTNKFSSFTQKKKYYKTNWFTILIALTNPVLQFLSEKKSLIPILLTNIFEFFIEKKTEIV